MEELERSVWGLFFDCVKYDLGIALVVGVEVLQANNLKAVVMLWKNFKLKLAILLLVCFWKSLLLLGILHVKWFLKYIHIEL